MEPKVLQTWHALVRDRDVAALDDLLADDAVFHSPVVHTPQRGKTLTTLYLTAAIQIFSNDTFRYVRQLVTGNEAVLEFELEIDGVQVNGVDILRWDDAGRVVDFKVMLRPLKAIELIHRKMAETLERAARSDRVRNALPERPAPWAGSA